MPLTSEQGYHIREEYSTIKEKKICDDLGLLQVGGSNTKVDGSNQTEKVSIKNASGSSTQVHLTTQNHFIKTLNLDEDSSSFIRLFCGDSSINNKGKDRYSIKEIDLKYVDSFQNFLNQNKENIVNLIVSNGYGITRVVYNDIKNNIQYSISYDDIINKIQNAEWIFLRGGVHLKLNGKTLFHFQREGKRNPKNRYNVLWHIHKNLFLV